MAQAYKKAILAGVDPIEFWQLTPYQTQIVMESSMERADKQAWLIAAFSRVKKLPKYESLTRGEKKQKDGLLLKKQLESMSIKETRNR